MAASAISEEFEDQVYLRSRLGQSYRSISRWLKEEHGIVASHEAVRTCVKRGRKYKRAANGYLPSVNWVRAVPSNTLAGLDEFLEAVRRRAVRGDNLPLFSSALEYQAELAIRRLDDEMVAINQLDSETHPDKMAISA